MAQSSKARVRIDKWLWAARFFKTRSQAASAIKSGRVELDGARAKPSHQVGKGSRLEVRKGPYRFTIAVDGVAERRGNAELAATLYTEDPDSVELREQTHARLRAERANAPYGQRAGRPTKRQRRQLLAFKEMSLFGEDWGDDET